jgi:hypothetical protein
MAAFSYLLQAIKKENKPAITGPFFGHPGWRHPTMFVIFSAPTFTPIYFYPCHYVLHDNVNKIRDQRKHMLGSNN